jgi:hypothetical protein
MGRSLNFFGALPSPNCFGRFDDVFPVFHETGTFFESW